MWGLEDLALGKFVHELVRQQLVHFLVIGVVLGVALQWFANRQETGPLGPAEPTPCCPTSMRAAA